MRRRRSHRRAEDVNSAVLADLFMAFGGIVFMLFIAALSALGVPEVTHAELRSEIVRADQLQGALQAQRDARAAEKHAADEALAKSKRTQQSLNDQANRFKEQREKWRATAQKRVEQLEEQKKKTSKLQGELSPRPLDVVIVIDGTSSMRPSIERLRESVSTLAEIAARVSPRFRLGIVVMRRRTVVFPMTAIAATEHGEKSTGMKALRSFTHEETEVVNYVEQTSGEYSGRSLGTTGLTPKLDTRISIVDLERGVRKGVELFDRNGVQKLLVVIGDMGPFELSDQNKVEPADHESARRTYALVREFAGNRAHVLALFTGEETKDLPHKNLSRTVFRTIAESAGNHGAYSSDASELSAITISAALQRPEVD